MEVAEIRRRAQRLQAGGATAEALAVLESGADRISVVNPGAASRLLVDGSQLAWAVSGAGRAVSFAERAVQLSSTVGGLDELVALTRLGDALSWAGRYAEAQANWRRATALEAGADPHMLCERANALIRLGDPTAHDAAYRALVASREAEDRDAVLDALNLATVAEIHAGRLQEALRNAEEALSILADERTVDAVDAIGLLAWVVALLGDEARCLALIDDADRRLKDLRITAPGGLARGLLALSMGRAADAVAAFESKAAEARLGPGAAMTWLRPFGAEFVEAYVRAGRYDDARRLLADISPVAMATGQPRLAAPVWRATGLVNDDEDAFETALTEHQRWGNRFEEARTRQVFGEFLRRRKRRAEAREQLGAAAATFEQLGALTWHDRATAELRLAGERTPTSRAFRPAGPEALTRQEGEVVELVRGGLSNREIANRLVLSVKTVEGHLTTIYGKFGVASRTQLVAALPQDMGEARPERLGR